LASLSAAPPEEAGPFEVAAHERNLSEPDQGIERPEAILLFALQAKRNQTLSLGPVGVSSAEGEHQKLVQFRSGMNVELEHGFRDIITNVSDDDPRVTAKIALAHLNEFPDYYTRLEEMEEQAKRDWAGR
jgi:hypothetical protein